MSQQWKNDSAGEDDVQVPLGAGGEAPQEESSGPTRPKINTSTLALVAAFAAGLILLYLLGLQNKPKAASAASTMKEQEISAKLTAFLGDKNAPEKVDAFLKDSHKLVEMLQKYFENRPKNVDETSNPFERPQIAEPLFVTPGKTTDVQPVQPTDPEAPELLLVAKQFATLKLQMVMLGNPSMAMINNRMVTVGTQLDLLVVSEIKADSVILSHKERKFTLMSTSPAMNKP